MAEPSGAASGQESVAPSGASGGEALRRARGLREKEQLAEAAEVLAAAVEAAVAERGADVHPALAELWLEYGDVLLELEEEEDQEPDDQISEDAAQAEDVQDDAGAATGEAEVQGEAGVAGEADADSAKAPAAEGPEDLQAVECTEGEEDDEAEDDLQLAWECLETARRCFEAQEGSGSRQALSRVHLRLADLLMMQNRADEAVEEYRTSLLLRLSNPPEPNAHSIPADASAVSSISRDCFVRLCMALVRAGRATSFHAAAADAQQLLAGLGDELVRHLGPANSASSDASVEDAVSDAVSGPVAQVAIRKRPRDEDPVLAAGASKARTST